MGESSEVKAAADDTHVGCEDLERKERTRYSAEECEFN